MVFFGVNKASFVMKSAFGMLIISFMQGSYMYYYKIKSADQVQSVRREYARLYSDKDRFEKNIAMHSLYKKQFSTLPGFVPDTFSRGYLLRMLNESIILANLQSISYQFLPAEKVTISKQAASYRLGMSKETVQLKGTINHIIELYRWLNALKKSNKYFEVRGCQLTRIKFNNRPVARMKNHSKGIDLNCTLSWYGVKEVG